MCQRSICPTCQEATCEGVGDVASRCVRGLPTPQPRGGVDASAVNVRVGEGQTRTQSRSPECRRRVKGARLLAGADSMGSMTPPPAPYFNELPLPT